MNLDSDNNINGEELNGEGLKDQTEKNDLKFDLESQQNVEKYFENEDLDQLVYSWNGEENKKYFKAKNTNKKSPKKIIKNAVILLVLILIATAISITSFKGKGWFLNSFMEVPRTQINIPIQSKPVLEEKYYNKETKKYTTQGIAKKVLPSVVYIESFSKDSGLTSKSQGSGIILTENGYIITNAHVIEEATKGILVVLNNGEEYQAKVVGADLKTDLAIIKIRAANLTVAEFGDSNQLEVGEEIVAIGNPGGLQGTVTKGIVSHLNRMVKTGENQKLMDCIQLDAAINPGNSGGALINMYGQVIGINSSKYTSEQYDGIGFAISINAAEPILEELISAGYIKNRVKIGITFYEINEQTAKIEEIKEGLLIQSISSDCDVANTKLRKDDIITHFDGKKMKSLKEVEKFLKTKKPGDKLLANVYRKSKDGKETTFDIEFKLMEDTSGRINMN